MHRKHVVVMLIVLSVSLLYVPAASAQAAPRAVPANDDFANAKPITIGKNYTVLDIGAATVDAGQPSVTGCNTTTIYHSVWFSILLPTPPFPDPYSVYLSTEGTRLIESPGKDSNDTVEPARSDLSAMPARLRS